MALDVQPLSMRRRVVMLVVMVGLLVGSLGFAQWLVGRAERVQAESRRVAPVKVPPGDAE